MTRTAPALQIHDDSHIGLSLRLVCLVRSWPSLGITRDNPLWGLKDDSGKVVAEGTDKAALASWAGKNYHDVAEQA